MRPAPKRMRAEIADDCLRGPRRRCRGQSLGRQDNHKAQETGNGAIAGLHQHGDQHCRSHEAGGEVERGRRKDRIPARHRSKPIHPRHRIEERGADKHAQPGESNAQNGGQFEPGRSGKGRGHFGEQICGHDLPTEPRGANVHDREIGELRRFEMLQSHTHTHA